MSRPLPRERSVVYIARDADGVVLYVGVTGGLGDRLRSHRGSSAWWKHMADFEVRGPFPTWSTALDAEDDAIWELGPIFNRPGTRDFAHFGLNPQTCLDTYGAKWWRKQNGIAEDAYLKVAS